jgi:hypothetical protein
VVEFNVLPLSIASKYGEKYSFTDLDSLVIRAKSEPQYLKHTFPINFSYSTSFYQSGRELNDRMELYPTEIV